MITTTLLLARIGSIGFGGTTLDERGDEAVAKQLRLKSASFVSGAGVIECALGKFEPDFSSEWSKACLGDLLIAHGQLGGVLRPELRERVEGWLREWDAQGATFLDGSPS